MRRVSGWIETYGDGDGWCRNVPSLQVNSAAALPASVSLLAACVEGVQPSMFVCFLGRLMLVVNA